MRGIDGRESYDRVGSLFESAPQLASRLVAQQNYQVSCMNCLREGLTCAKCWNIENVLAHIDSIRVEYHRDFRE